MLAILTSVKLAILGILKITVFWNKGYNVIISAHDVTILFHDFMLHSPLSMQIGSLSATLWKSKGGIVVHKIS